MAAPRIDSDRVAAGIERIISLEGLESTLLPSKLLQNWVRGDPPRNFLLRYGDDVIEHDYKGIIHWGIILTGSKSCVQDVSEAMAAWSARVDPSICESFEKELLSQAENFYWDDFYHFVGRPRNCIIEKFPAIKHDLILLDLQAHMGRVWRRGFHEKYKNWLMAFYDDDDTTEDPSYGRVIVRSYLKSREMAKHSEKSLGKNDLERFHRWLSSMTRSNQYLLCKEEKAAILFELLQNTKLHSSQLLDESDMLPLGVYIYDWQWQSSWRSIMKLLSEGADQQNEKQQYPLHVLLANHLPGHDILFDACPKIVQTICPVENMYPFQLAARERNYEDTIVAENETLTKNLNREHLSQTCLLLREYPEPLTHLLKALNLEFAERYTEKSKEYYSECRRVDKVKAELEIRKREIGELERKIAKEKDSCAKKREALNEEPMWKTTA